MASFLSWISEPKNEFINAEKARHLVKLNNDLELKALENIPIETKNSILRDIKIFANMGHTDVMHTIREEDIESIKEELEKLGFVVEPREYTNFSGWYLYISW